MNSGTRRVSPQKRRFWPHESPRGARLRIGGQDQPLRTVIGVISDVRERGLQLDMKPAVYLPFTQVKGPGVYLLVRTATEPMALADSVRNALWPVDGEQPVALIRTMDEYAAIEMRNRGQQMTIFTISSGAALFLAELGVYGVLAYAVAQRRREIGIRRAVGANTARVTSLIVRQGVTLAALGLGIARRSPHSRRGRCKGFCSA